MKKLAIRIGVILAIVVACSMFFANTIMTITTAKVRYAPVGFKRFEEPIRLEGKLHFANTEKVTVEAARKTPITVERMYVRVGDPVAKGDTICTAKLSTTFETELNTSSQAVIAAEKAYMDNEITNIKLVDTTDSDKNEAKRLLDETSKALVEAQGKLMGDAAVQGIILGEDVKKWADAIQKSENADLAKLMDGVLDAQIKADNARNAFLTIFENSKTKEEVYNFLNKRDDLQRSIDKAKADLRELVTASEAMKVIRAEHDGYIVTIGLTEGAMYDGNSAAYEISAEGEAPMLRCEVTGKKREFAEGMQVAVKGEYDSIKMQVTSVVREGVDKKFLHIALSQDVIDRLGGVRSLLNTTVNAELTYRAKDSTCILPTKAVREDTSGGYYVLVAEYQYNGFMGQEKIVARRVSVTVIDQGTNEYSIREDLRYGSQPVYGEDRYIEDGTRIMQYVN